MKYQPLVITVVKSAKALINNRTMSEKKIEEKREVKRDKDGNIIEEEFEVEEKKSD